MPNEKLKALFKRCNGPFLWRDFVTLIGSMGYEPIGGGKSSGAGRKFFNPISKDMILAHQPHDKDMAKGMVKRLQKHMNDRGLLDEEPDEGGPAE